MSARSFGPLGWSDNGPLLGIQDPDSRVRVRVLRDGHDQSPFDAVHVVDMSTEPLNRSGSAAAPTRLLTTEELAEYLQIPARTLEDWRHRDYGPKFARMGKRVRY